MVVIMNDKLDNIKNKINEKPPIDGMSKFIPPETEPLKQSYGRIMQGAVTNEIMRPLPEKMPTSIDPISNIAEIEFNDVKMFVEEYKDNKTKIQTRTFMFLDFLMYHSPTQGNQIPKNITFSIKEYMEIRGLRDTKNARNQIKQEMENLNKISLTFTDKSKGKKNEKDFLNIGIGANEYGIRRGQVYFKLGDTFHKVVTERFFVMPYPRELMEMNANTDKSRWHILRFLVGLKNMNRGKANENRITVGTILERCKVFPEYEDIREEGRIYQRIIEPFERVFDSIKSFNWHYTRGKGQELTDEELKDCLTDYHLWKNLMVEIEWHDYPIIPLSKKQKKR